MSNFNNLLTFHRPPWVRGAEYYASHVFDLHRLGLWKGPVYPTDWFAGAWERVAIAIIKDLEDKDGQVTAETFSSALARAISWAEETHSRRSAKEVLQYRDRRSP